ncbi:hypothetical protein [Nocardioides humi]|uniref:BioF2-like acetyltransferase domain-containing protein n=1 Tax=Nocardioides humi TaxID=449461 RepID=A0ABN1ZRN2_9ACTN|nr:hypothetical protein [Nocardioides humi]
MEADERSVAARWFGVRAEYEEHAGGQTAWDVVKHVLLGVVTLGLTFVDYDPRRRCNVLVVRHDDGTAVAGYDHSTVGDATLHVSSLLERLDTLHVFDFCRELGIPVDAVVGEGRGQDGPSAATWRGYDVGMLPVL